MGRMKREYNLNCAGSHVFLPDADNSRRGTKGRFPLLAHADANSLTTNFSVQPPGPIQLFDETNWTVSCIDLEDKRKENEAMFRDPTIVDRSIIDRSIYQSLSGSGDDRTNDRALTDRASSDSSKIASSTPLGDAASKSGLENQPVPLTPNIDANPEFAKWWKRWASRVRRISVRKNPPARRIKIDPRSSDPKAARSMAAECEFKRYL